jgi:hypothetical protein
MIKPLDVLVRVAALPHLAWGTSGAILEARRRLTDAFFGDPSSNEFAGRMYDGFFDRVEEQCRSRWRDVFAAISQGDDEDDESRAA